MEGAETFPVLSSLFQMHIFGYKVDNVNSVLYFLKGAVVGRHDLINQKILSADVADFFVLFYKPSKGICVICIICGCFFTYFFLVNLLKPEQVSTFSLFFFCTSSIIRLIPRLSLEIWPAMTTLR